MTDFVLLRMQMSALMVHMQAVIAAIDQEAGAGAVVGGEDGGYGTCPNCKASGDKIVDDSTIGRKISRCTVCGTEWDR